MGAPSQNSSKNRELELLEVIERSPKINQRSLAKETQMALGLVNSCLKRLVRKGWVKIREVPGRRFLYYLTPQGMSEKSRLTYEYISYSVHFYGTARARCRALFQELVEKDVRRVAFLGKSDLAEIAYITLREYPIEFDGIFDVPEVQGASFLGHTVRSMEELKGDGVLAPTTIYTRIEPPDESFALDGAELIEIFK